MGILAREQSKPRRVAMPRPNAKTPPLWGGVFVWSMRSLTITYFHTGIRTIIGVESFHGPVRDGKGWDRLAMVIRHDLLLPRLVTLQPIWEEVEVFGVVIVAQRYSTSAAPFGGGID